MQGRVLGFGCRVCLEEEGEGLGHRAEQLEGGVGQPQQQPNVDIEGKLTGESGSRVRGLVVRVEDFGLRIAGFGLRVSGFGFRVSG